MKDQFTKLYSCIQKVDSKVGFTKAGDEIASIHLSVVHIRTKTGNGPWHKVEDIKYVLLMKGARFDRETFDSVASAKRWYRRIYGIRRYWAVWKKV